MKKTSLATPISPCLLIEEDAGMLFGAAEVRAERIELFGEDSDSDVDAGANHVEIVANVDHGIRAPLTKKSPVCHKKGSLRNTTLLIFHLQTGVGFVWRREVGIVTIRRQENRSLCVCRAYRWTTVFIVKRTRRLLVTQYST